MPSIKPQLRTRVTEKTKTAFDAHAKQQGLSEARLLEVVITDFLQYGAPMRKAALVLERDERSEVKSEDVRVRLSPFAYNALDQLAAHRNWKRGTYLRHLFMVHLTAEPRFSVDEIAALRQLTAQLSSLGRDVNHIARSLSSAPDDTQCASATPFEKMKVVIDEARTHIKDLIRSNLTAWGVTDGN